VAQRSQAHVALGAAVRDLRTLRGISQEDLAHLSGMHRTYLGDIERGQRNPSYTNIRKIAKGLDVKTSDLLARAESFERMGDEAEQEEEADTAQS
jgi:transcriptional regulator with XRE-family HTH domain